MPDRTRLQIALACGLFLWLTPLHAAQSKPAPPAAPAADSLGRQDPRSAVTGFLEACRNQDYQKAAQYLDLRQLSPRYRAQQGPELARKLEAILNSDARFNVLGLNRSPEGDRSDDSDPNREHAATITGNGRNMTLDLERVTIEAGGPQVWLFSRDTVAAIPSIHTPSGPSAIERFLPQFLVSHRFLETPLWKWLALIALSLLMISVSRLVDWLLALVIKLPVRRFKPHWNIRWLETIIEPLRVILLLAVLRIGIAFINPSAIARIYIGRGLELILVSCPI